MTWVIWRQHRQQAIVALAAFGALALFFWVTGPMMSHTYHASGLALCGAKNLDCGDLLNAFDVKYGAFSFVVPLFLVLPAFIGVFWGAPLIARELEQGTYRFAWTQSVSRRRWATTKIATVGGATFALGAAFAALATWWSFTLVIIHGDKFVPGIFDLRGLVPVGYALFAIALGIALGQIIGRVLPAMGATLVGFAVVRILVDVLARKHYMAPKTATSAIGTFKFDAAPRGGWVLSQNTLDRAGHIVAPGGGLDFKYMQTHCPNIPAPGTGRIAVPFGGKDPVLACASKLGLHTQAIFQPANRYWTFQWIEFGIYTALAVALVAFVIWRIKRFSR
jgi:hypothetical protein